LFIFLLFIYFLSVFIAFLIIKIAKNWVKIADLKMGSCEKKLKKAGWPSPKKANKKTMK